MKNILLSAIDIPVLVTLILSYLSALVSLKDPVAITSSQHMPQCGTGSSLHTSSQHIIWQRQAVDSKPRQNQSHRKTSPIDDGP